MLRSVIQTVSVGDEIQVIFSQNTRNGGVMVKGLQKLGFVHSSFKNLNELNSGDEWRVRVLEITSPNEKTGVIKLFPISKCEKKEEWEISDSEYGIQGISLPKIAKKVTVGERVESESFNYSISAASHINAEWSEEIKSELKTRLDDYLEIRKKAVEAIQWPDSAPTQEKVEYNDGTLCGTMTCRLCFFDTVGVGMETTFTSPQLGNSWEYKRIPLSPLTKITTHEEWEEILKVLGEPKEIKQFDYLHPEKGIMLCWGEKHFGEYQVEMQMCLDVILPNAEIELSSSKKDYRSISYKLLIAWKDILTELSSGLTLHLEGLSEILCSLNREETRIEGCELREDRVPQIVRPHFNKNGTDFTPEVIREELVKQFVKHFTMRSWNTMWKEYILHGQEERSKEPRSKIRRLLGEIKVLLSNEEEVESFYVQEKTSEYEGYSPDGMRGGTYSTSYVDVHYYSYGGYSRRWGNPLLHGSSQQEIKTAILETVVCELEEIGKTYQIWLTTPLEYAPEKENCLYISGKPEDIEGLDSLETQMEQEASELLENISQSIENSKQFIAQCGATSENVSHLKRKAKRLNNLIQVKSFPLGNAEQYREEARIYAKIAEKGEAFQLGRAVEKLNEIHSHTIKNLKQIEQNNLPATREEAESALKKCESILEELLDAYHAQFIWNEFYNLRSLVHDMKFNYNNSGNFVRMLEIASDFLPQAEPILQKWQEKVQTDKVLKELTEKEFSCCPLCGQQLRKDDHYCLKLFQKGGLEKDFDIKIAKSGDLEIAVLAAKLDPECLQHFLYVWTSDKEIQLQTLEEIAVETIWTLDDASSDKNILLTTGGNENSLFGSALAKAEKKKKK